MTVALSGPRGTPLRWGGPALQRGRLPVLRLRHLGAAKETSQASDTPEELASAQPGQVPPQRWRRWRRAWLAMRRNGVVYLFSYALISHVNLALMFGVAWALFVRTWRTCPVKPNLALPLVAKVTCAFYQPQLLNPKFLAYYGAIALSVGSLTRPVRAGMAAAFTPVTRRCLRFFQESLSCPQPLAYLLTVLVGVLAGTACFAPAVFASCALLSVPVIPGL